MSTLVWIALISTTLIGLVIVLGRRAAHTHAPKPKSTARGRGGRMGGLVLRSMLRRLYLRLRQALASRDRRRRMEEQYHVKTAEEVTEMMGQMKGVFMKLGQIMSFAHPSLPEQAKATLRTLQSDAPPMDFHLARGVLEQELGGDLARFFKHVDETPLAAASIGQVHRARLNSGEQVVLKIQYPGVDSAIESDLQMTAGLAAMVQLVHRNTDAKSVVHELKTRLLEELDYRRELRNQALFGALWAGHPLIKVPAVHSEYSTKRVLCQEFCRGMNFYDFLAVATPEEKRRATFILNDFVFDSMHRFHVFNGDPHPGNYLFGEDGSITFVDFGCIKYFPAHFMQGVQALNRAIFERDHESFERCVKELQIILPGRPYDPEIAWRFFSYHAAPFMDDQTFRFSPEYIGRATDVMNPKTLKNFNLPPDLLFFNRITFGLNTIFMELGAEANFHRLYRRYLYPHEGQGPALASLGVELEDRFIETSKRPVTPPSQT